jgi:RNA polymerase sigma factor (TIGR02999 family)
MPSEISRLLEEHRAGNPDAVNRLTPQLYDELRRIAAYYMRGERPDHSLQPTALVHEAYLRLVGQDDLHWESRAHFFAIAARAMRNILVDRARARGSAKRGGDVARVPLDEVEALVGAPDLDYLALDAALDALERVDPQQCRVVELRYFAGLGIEETADALGVSPATVKRDWAMAKVWLRRRIEGSHD